MQQHIRGTEISMIFQEPMTALNPVFRIGDQIMETLRQHQRSNRQAAFSRAVEMLTAVGIPSPRNRMADYPHSLSGGMRQRVMIAMALACRPKILIADEPTTALDVTIQAQILDLLKRLQQEFAMAVMLITHDLGVIAEFCNRVMVMYAGWVIERGTREQIFGDTVHPYTEGLLNSIPTLNDDMDRLHTVPGVVPSAYAMPRGCRFEPRCHYRMDRCMDRRPPFFTLAPGHEISCYRFHSNGEVVTHRD
jgi:oligopeptide/dipeptide ABC transporter ATP-binding protein